MTDLPPEDVAAYDTAAWGRLREGCRLALEPVEDERADD